MIKKNTYFQKFIQERNIKTETIKSYQQTINKYTQYYQTNFDTLIQEAINEENNTNIPKRQRSIKNRLLQFRTHLKTETNLKTSTIKGHIQNLYALYGHFDIDLPRLPPLKETDKILTTYYDLPSKEHLRMAVDIAGIRIGSLILFMISSGTARTECANMTIQTFTDACKEYTNEETLPEIIEDLDNNIKPIVPTFYLYRQKTDKPYYTFCTPETTNAIVEWLKLRLEVCEENNTELKFTDSLWGLNKRQISYHLANVNDELGLGFKGCYRFIRPHTLRKFNASNLGLANEHIDLLQGRSKSKIHETYIKTNPEWLKKLYMNAMENMTLNDFNKKEIIHQDFTININLNFFGDSFETSL